MARGSGSSGTPYTYKEWAAAQKDHERQKRQADKDRIAAEAAARDEDAAAKTEAIERRVAELETLLRFSLARDPRISLNSLRRTTTIQPLDLGSDADPIPAPPVGRRRAPGAKPDQPDAWR